MLNVFFRPRPIARKSSAVKCKPFVRGFILHCNHVISLSRFHAALSFYYETCLFYMEPCLKCDCV